MTDRPLVSFCLASYNQREYVGAAVESALAQDYPHLEIIIADDGSTDGSPALIRRLVEGDSRVRILPSERNLGRARNYERMYALAQGELIVSADGDDISEPNRVSALVAAWLADGKRAMALYSDGIKIDPQGRTLPGGLGRRSHLWPLGAVMAFSPRVVREFPPIEVEGASQDHVFAARAVMLGSELTVDAKLVRWRVGSGISSLYRSRRKVDSEMAVMRLASARQVLADLDCREDKGPALPELRRRYEEYVRQNEWERDLSGDFPWRVRWRAFRSLFRGAMLTRGAWLRLPYLLPKRMGDVIYGVELRLRFLRRRCSR